MRRGQARLFLSVFSRLAQPPVVGVICRLYKARASPSKVAKLCLGAKKQIFFIFRTHLRSRRNEWPRLLTNIPTPITHQLIPQHTLSPQILRRFVFCHRLVHSGNAYYGIYTYPRHTRIYTILASPPTKKSNYAHCYAKG